LIGRMITNQLLYQLSYEGLLAFYIKDLINQGYLIFFLKVSM